MIVMARSQIGKSPIGTRRPAQLVLMLRRSRSGRLSFLNKLAATAAGTSNPEHWAQKGVGAVCTNPSVKA
jgi:hypothetical protein